VNEEQMQLTECKANHFKTEMDRLRDQQNQMERERLELQKKIQDADFYVQQLTMEKDKREAETEKLKNELLCAKMAEREATARLLNFLNSGRKSSADSILSTPVEATNPAIVERASNHSTPSLSASNSSADMETAGAVDLSNENHENNDNCDDFEPKEFILTKSEMEQITNEMERSRLEYIKKTKQVQNQLQTLRSEIEILKIEGNQSNFDILSEAQIKAGETKYSTLKKLKSGSTKARVAFFEEL